MIILKKTNILVEVSDDLFSEVVEPYKKRKGLGRLVVQLLEAYRSNDSIYSYINGTLDGLEADDTKELLKNLSDMSESLSMLGIMQEEAEVVIDEGQRSFNDIAGGSRGVAEPVEPVRGTVIDNTIADSNSSNSSSNSSINTGLSKEDIVSIVRGIVDDSLAGIRVTLDELMKSGRVSEPEADRVHGMVESKVVADVGKAIVSSRDSSADSTEEENEASDAINSLLGSLNFT